MDRLRTLGVGMTLLSLVGYAAGVAVQYPGRALSVTGVMVGITLAATAGGWGGEQG